MNDVRADLVRNLFDLLSDLARAQTLLKESYNNCHAIGTKQNYEAHELIEFEAFAGRFSRASDLLLQKVFRAIDSVELVEGGTLIDALNRAHKRGLIDNLEQMYKVRQLRNLIVHEYLPKGLEEIFGDLLVQAPTVFGFIDRTAQYSEQFKPF